MNAQIEWIESGSSLPDDEITVLLATEDGDVESGFHDGQHWRWASGGIVEEPVTHWADMPNHPFYNKKP